MGSSLTAPNRASASGSVANVIGNGIVMHKDGVQIARPLLAGPGIKIKNGDGVEGKPTFSTFPPGHIAMAKRVPLHVAGETILQPDVEGIRLFRITHVLICNATAASSGSVSAGIYTLTGKAGDAVLPPTALAGLTDNLYSTLKLDPSSGMQRARAAPYLFFVPEVLSPVEMYVDVYVRGEILDWEIG